MRRRSLAFAATALITIMLAACSASGDGYEYDESDPPGCPVLQYRRQTDEIVLSVVDMMENNNPSLAYIEESQAEVKRLQDLAAAINVHECLEFKHGTLIWTLADLETALTEAKAGNTQAAVNAFGRAAWSFGDFTDWSRHILPATATAVP